MSAVPDELSGPRHRPGRDQAGTTRPDEPGAALWLRGARLAGRGACDVLVGNGRIEQVVPSRSTGASAPDAADRAEELNLSGYLLIERLVEPHLHLDKVFLAERFPERDWTLTGAIDAWISYCDAVELDDLVARGSEVVRRYLAAGVTALRAHVDTVPAQGLLGVEAALEVRRRFAGVVDLDIVAGCFIPATGVAGAANLGRLRDALAAGADCVGGFPSLDPDPPGAVMALAEVAAELGAPLDLHVDETTDPDVFALARLIEIAAAGFPHPVNASHAVTLGLLPPAEQRAVAGRMAEAGVSVVSLPQTNLLLQGRGAGSLAPRGLTALRPLLEAGVALGAGGDNIQDGFNPLGRADPLETASLLVAAGHLGLDESLRAVSSGAARVIGCGAGGLGEGDPADFVAIRAASLSEAVAGASPERLTFRGGRLVARTSVQTELAPIRPSCAEPGERAPGPR